MIADLKQELLCPTTMQKALIAAVLSITMTDLRHTDPFLIIMAQMCHSVHIQGFPQCLQCRQYFCIFLCSADLAQAFSQSLYCFQLRGSPAFLVGSYTVFRKPEQDHCRQRCQRYPAAGGIARWDREFPRPRSWRTLRGSLICSGVWSVLLISDFQGAVRGSALYPLTSLPEFTTDG